MTLKEAHELQRRELISLKAENVRLRKQTSGIFPVEEKETLERHIRHLNQVIETLEKRYASSRSQWKQREAFVFDLEMENTDLKEQLSSCHLEISDLKSRLEKAEAEVRELNGTNAKLNRRLHTGFENSSLPSSALPFRKKVPNSRKPTGRTQGAQPGHKPHTASRLLTTKEPVYLPTPEHFLASDTFYPTGKTITKQVIDISVYINVQDYIADEYRNRTTGSRVHAPFPAGVVNDVNYGASLKAFAFLLNNYYNVSIAKTKQFISDVTNGVVSLSTGTINHLSTEFSLATVKDRAKIFSLLTHSDVLYSDAAVSNINGSRKAVILFTDREQILYQHLSHKGHDGLSQTPVKEFKGTLIHDHDMSYYSYGSSHQECLAHVLRYLVGAIENEPHLTWHKKMHSHIQRMIHTVKRNRDGIPADKIKSLTEKYEEILSLAEAEYIKSPPSKEYPDGFNLQKRLRKFQKAHLFFLTHPDIDYTNNISERGLRKFKRKQKQAVVFRSETGGQLICDALTIIETARLQKKNIYDVAQKAFQKTN